MPASPTSFLQAATTNFLSTREHSNCSHHHNIGFRIIFRGLPTSFISGLSIALHGFLPVSTMTHHLPHLDQASVATNPSSNATNQEDYRSLVDDHHCGSFEEGGELSLIPVGSPEPEPLRSSPATPRPVKRPNCLISQTPPPLSRLLQLQIESATQASQTSSGVLSKRDTPPEIEYQKRMRHAPGLEWWPPNHHVDSSDLCKECRQFDFRAAVCHPPARDDQRWVQIYQRWIQIYQRDARSYQQTVTDSNGIDWPVNDSNCQFCRYLVSARRFLPKGEHTGKYFIVFHHPETQKSSSSRCEHGFLGSVSAFCITVQSTFVPDLLCTDIQIICHVDRPSRRARSPQVVSPIFNVSLAKAWLDACNRNDHPECFIKNDAQMPKTRLIDCFTRKLISVGDNAIQNPRFVALSYVWGPNVRRTTLSEDLPSKLPLTIRDAMTVTKDLGLEYLWVDQYCIDQSDNGDKDRQIRHMDLIYKCADITIIAAAGYDCDYGLPGVSDRSRDVLDPFLLDGNLTLGICPNANHTEGYYKKEHWETGSWHTRGWTFQEAHLSRRRLVFSDTATHFECMRHGDCQTELFGGVECADIDAVEKHYSVDSRPERPHSNGDWVDIKPVVGKFTLSRPAKLDKDLPQPVRHQDLIESIFSYTELVGQYTLRYLSHTSDGLNAFRGAANALAQFDPPVYNIAGVPFVVHGHGEDSLTDITFSYGLAWRSPDLECDVVHVADFPSWSWGNVGVWNVFWNIDRGVSQWLAANTIDHPREIQIEFNNDGSKRLIGLVEFAEACRNSTPLSRWNPTALCFEARILSPHVTVRFPMQWQVGDSLCFWGHGDGGFGGLGPRRVDLVVNITGTPSDEQSDKNGEAGQGDHSQPHCLIQAWDERFCDKIVSGRYGFMLLRCNSEEALVLVVEWQHEPSEPQKTARRIGMIVFETGMLGEEFHADEFLNCFSNETDIRLI